MHSSDDPAIRALDAAAAASTVMSGVRATLERVTKQLQASSAAMAWDTVPLALFGSMLPISIASCWVFVIQAGAQTTAERHPNSHQRSVSLTGRGEFQLWDGRGWQPHPLSSSATGPIDERWVTIPPSTWHRLAVGGEPWGMLSFHTVAVPDLIEEKPTELANLDGPTVQHRYEGRP